MYGYYGYGLYDPTMILVLIGAVLSLWASAKVKNTFNRYSSVRSMTGMTGAEAAQRLLNSQGIYDVTVRPVSGQLTDHYDPRTKTVNLSDGVYSSTSVAAIGVAAHECGHAIQDNVGYVPLRMRAAFVPVVNFGSQLSWPLILIGLLIGGAGSTIVNIGIWMFVLVVLFQLITLPVELNASHRAVETSGFHWYFTGKGSRTDQKGIRCSSPHICGGSSSFCFAASASDHVIRRTKRS